MGTDRIISADEHVHEPVDLWTTRAEPGFRDRVPYVVRQEDSDRWYCDGQMLIALNGATQTGLRFEEKGHQENTRLNRTGRVEDKLPGSFIAEERVKDMDLDGIAVSVIYPSVGLLMYILPDSELVNYVFRLYNDWLAEWCGKFPDRLKGIGQLNLDDVQEGVKELERCAKLGLAGAMITVSPPRGREYLSPEYEPLWAAAQDLEMPLSLHVATNRMDASSDTETWTPAFVCNSDYWVRMSLSHMIYNGVFERYPKLQVGSVEHESSWVPNFLWRLDYNYTDRAHRAFWYKFKEDMLPSDYFHRNVFVGFQEDALGIKDRRIIGIDNLQWGSDYPHQESTFPRSGEILEEILADCTEEEKAKMVCGNAARVYHLD